MRKQRSLAGIILAASTFLLLVGCLSLAPGARAAPCYVLQDVNRNLLLWRGQMAPVDLSYPPYSQAYQRLRQQQIQVVITNVPDADCESFILADDPVVRQLPFVVPVEIAIQGLTKVRDGGYSVPTTRELGWTPGIGGHGGRYGCAENGSCYGDISSSTGRSKTTPVNGYYRSNGTYVRGHYRSSRR